MINLLNDLLDVGNESYEIKRLEKELFKIYFCNGITSLKKIIDIIDNIYKASNINISLKLYRCSNDALKEIRSHKGEVFIDLNKTFSQDCLWKE